MKVRITFDLDKEVRQALESWYGQEGLASHDDCRAHIRAVVESDLADIRDEYDLKVREDRG